MPNSKKKMRENPNLFKQINQAMDYTNYLDKKTEENNSKVFYYSYKILTTNSNLGSS